MTEYDATQKQRAFERRIRATKRDLSGLDAAIKETDNQSLKESLQAEFDRKSVLLKKQEARIRDFTHQTSLYRDRAREQSYGFNKSVSQKAVWSNKHKIIIQSGGKNDIGSVEWLIHRNEIATLEYEKIRMSDDIEIVANNSGMSVNDITKIKNHIFFNKHIKYDGTIERFDADYDMAVAWNRLVNGCPKERDLLLLRHELLESQLEMEYNITASEAHARASEVYAWDEKLLEELGEGGEKDGLL